MRLFFRLLRRLAMVLAAACWLLICVCGTAFAQRGAQPPAQSGSTTTGAGAYVMAYLLVILGITLGMLFVCRSSGRRDRARPEVYGEAKVGVKPPE